MFKIKSLKLTDIKVAYDLKLVKVSKTLFPLRSLLSTITKTINLLLITLMKNNISKSETHFPKKLRYLLH